ncbi:hypothetical protein [Hydrogenimonas sp.]
MENHEPTITLRPETYDDLLACAQMLGIPPEVLVDRALEAFLAEIGRQMGEKESLADNAQTNLSYDEFWDGVDLE